MRRLLCLAMCLLVATTALGAHTEFYVTKGGSVSDVNGGGPSLAANDAPVDTEANCSSDVAGTSVTNDDADGWAGSSVDDWICFDTAGSKDFARITNIAGDVLTVTPAVTGSQAAKNVNVGGAWATIDHAASTVTATSVNGAGDWPRINVKYDAVAYTETVTMDNDGTVTLAITLEGYETSAGDSCPNGNLPQITGNLVVSDRLHLRILNLKIITTAAGVESVTALNTKYSWFHNLHLKATGAGAHAVEITSGFENHLSNVYVEDAAAVGLSVTGWDNKLIDCFVRSAGTYGIYMNGELNVCVRCVVDSSADDCFYALDEGHVMQSCVGYGSAGGSGMRIVDGADTHVSLIQNCIFYGNNQYGIEAAGVGLTTTLNSAFGGNGVAATLNLAFEIGTVTLTGDPFTNAAGGDFSIIDGGECDGKGFPGAMLDGTNIGHIDIGALQDDDPPGGGTVSPYRGRLSGGLE